MSVFIAPLPPVFMALLMSSLQWYGLRPWYRLAAEWGETTNRHTTATPLLIVHSLIKGISDLSSGVIGFRCTRRTPLPCGAFRLGVRQDIGQRMLRGWYQGCSENGKYTDVNLEKNIINNYRYWCGPISYTYTTLQVDMLLVGISQTFFNLYHLHFIVCYRS